MINKVDNNVSIAAKIFYMYSYSRINIFVSFLKYLGQTDIISYRNSKLFHSALYFCVFWSIYIDQNSFLESFFSSEKVQKSEYSATHKSDGLRILALYKFGGFYLDLDYVVLQDLTHYLNILVRYTQRCTIIVVCLLKNHIH